MSFIESLTRSLAFVLRYLELAHVAGMMSIEVAIIVDDVSLLLLLHSVFALLDLLHDLGSLS